MTDDGTAAAALVCLDPERGTMLRFFATTREAQDAAASVPCRDSCVGAHSVVSHDSRYRVRSFGDVGLALERIAKRHEVQRLMRKARARVYNTQRQSGAPALRPGGRCRYGHLMIEQNVYLVRGRRGCRACAARSGNSSPHSATAATPAGGKGGNTTAASPGAYGATQPESLPDGYGKPVELQMIRAQTQERRNRRRHRKGQR